MLLGKSLEYMVRTSSASFQFFIMHRISQSLCFVNNTFCNVYPMFITIASQLVELCTAL